MATSYASFDIISNIAQSLLPIEELVTGAAYMIGIVLIMKGITSLKKHAESSHGGGQGGGVKEAFVYFLVGGMLVYFPSGFEVLLNTTFGYSNVLAYAPQNSQNSLINALFGSSSSVGQDLGLFIQVIGVFAFVRGWLLITRSAGTGQPPGGTGKGIMHVFGGILAMNIIGTLQVINNTLYGAGS